MKFYNRAWRALCHYRRNTLLLFLIFAILFSLILSGLCVRGASQETTRQMGIEIGGSIQVETKQRENGHAAFTLESAQKIAAHSAVSGSVLSSETAACTARAMSAQFDDVEVREQNVTLMGANGSHPDLTESCKVLEGRRPGPEDHGFAVLNSWMQEKFRYQLGDVIKVSADKAGNRQVELTIIGFVYNPNAGYHYGPPEFYAENLIFTDLETVAQVSGSTDLRAAQYQVHDPAQIPQLMADIEAMDLPDRDNLLFIALDGDYQKLALAMESIVTVASIIFWAALALGAVLLAAMVMISLSSREFEIGVLLSMGESRWKVILQLVLETLCPVLLGITAGVLVSSRMAGAAGEILGAAERGVEVTLQGSAIGAVYLCGVGLALLASFVTGYKVLRCHPKTLLMNIE